MVTNIIRIKNDILRFPFPVTYDTAATSRMWLFVLLFKWCALAH